MSRTWIVIGLYLACAPIWAQNFQTDFAAIKVDRGRTPATFHGGVKVDEGSGSVSVDVPLGPGIGLRGLHFTPTLHGSWSPQWSAGVKPLGDAPYLDPDTGALIFTPNIYYYNEINGSVPGGFGPIQGGLVLNLSDGTGFGNLTSWHNHITDANDVYYSPPMVQDETQARIQFPDGRGESLNPTSPGYQTVPSLNEINNMLHNIFHFDAAWTVSKDPHQAGSDTGAPGYMTPDSIPSFLHMGTGGSLIVGIFNAGSTSDGRYYYANMDVAHNAPDGAFLCAQYDSPLSAQTDAEVLPPRILVIQGEIAYEYTCELPYYTQAIDLWGRGFMSASRPDYVHFLMGVSYQLTRMLNRFGDAIQFTYGAIPSATWIPGDGSAQASIQLGSTISYQGGSEAFEFQPITGTLPPIYPWVNSTFPGNQKSILERYAFYTGFKNVGTNESIIFHYSDLGAPTYPNCRSGIDSNVVETVISGVDFPGRSVNVAWGTYMYRHNASWTLLDDSSWAADANNNLTSTHLPHWGAGAISVVETDTSTGTSRTTTHQRVVPQPNLGSISTGTEPWWTSTDFYDAITHPDGSVTITAFVEPPVETASQGRAVPSDAGGKMLRLAYLKHQAREVREYAPPTDSQGSDYALTDFLGTRSNPSQSLAYQIVFSDRWDLHGPTNMNSTPSFSETSEPFPTRTRIWNREKGIITIKEISGWDSVNRGYTTTTIWITKDTSILATIDPLARSFNNDSLIDPPGYIYKKSDLSQLGSKADQWFWNRELLRSPRVDVDITAGKASGYTLPFSDSPIAKIYEDKFNQVTSITRGANGAPQASVAFTFGQAGVAQAQLISALVTGTYPGGSFVNSGTVGVNYSYDSSGYLASIRPLGVTWQRAQSQDLFGLPQSQTDPNGKVTSFQWDDGGRLRLIHPPDGLVDTIITPDSDNMGITVTRGLEASRYRFNGFGELVLEQRSLDGGNTWSSHREFSYDLGGRRIGATVWLTGAGVESEWNKPNLVQNANVQVLVSPGYWTYDCLDGTDASGNCIGRTVRLWTPPVYQSVSLTPLYLGTATSYDGQGRVSKIVEPTNPALVTTFDYSGSTKTVTVGTAATVFGYDEVGRMTSVTNALGEVTSYRYDPIDRIAQVIQQDAAGRTQVRTWSYTPLGWLNQLVQPESGVTNYGGFTVTGKPTQTTYGANTSTPLIVNKNLDTLDRPLTISSNDGSIDQTFIYDQGSIVDASNGKLKQGRDKGIILDYVYGGMGGALSNLNTTIWSGGQINSGTPQEFSQTFGYDSYGHRNGGNTGKNSWTQSWDVTRSMPSVLSYGGQPAVSASYDSISWSLRRLDYGNHVATTFDYGPDQSGLSQMVHLPISGAAWGAWSYTYDERGNLIKIADSATYSTDGFGYDPLNRLTDVDVFFSANGSMQEFAQSFHYDPFGNRDLNSTWQVITTNGVKSASFSSLPNQLQNTDFRGQAYPELVSLSLHNQLPGKTATGASTGANYDVYGNLKYIWSKVGDPTSQVTLNYDALGRVTTLGRQDGTQERYYYTPDGLRTVIEEWLGGSMVRRRYMIYNDARQLTSEYDLVLE